MVSEHRQACCKSDLLRNSSSALGASVLAGPPDANGARKGKPAKASLRKACTDALLVILKAEDPALMALEQRCVRGLSALQADQAAEEAIKRRNMYASGATERQPLALITSDLQVP